MQKVFCDRQVNWNGVEFFRVQGTTAWIFNKRKNTDTAGVTNISSMLVSSEKVVEGFFVYRALSNSMSIRSYASVHDKYRTASVITKGSLVSVDVLI